MSLVIPQVIIDQFNNEMYDNYRLTVVPEVHYSDDNVYVSDDEYISKEEFIKTLEPNKIYEYIYKIDVSDKNIIDDLNYYYTDSIFEAYGNYYMYYSMDDLINYDALTHIAVKYNTGYLTLNNTVTDDVIAFKWNYGMIVDDKGAKYGEEIPMYVYDPPTFKSHIIELEDKCDPDKLYYVNLIVERMIYDRDLENIKWLIREFPKVLETIYYFDFMNYIIYKNDIELFTLLLPAVKHFVNYGLMLVSTLKYNKQEIFNLIINDNPSVITDDVKIIIAKYNKTEWLPKD